MVLDYLQVLEQTVLLPLHQIPHYMKSGHHALFLGLCSWEQACQPRRLRAAIYAPGSASMGAGNMRCCRQGLCLARCSTYDRPWRVSPGSHVGAATPPLLLFYWGGCVYTPL